MSSDAGPGLVITLLAVVLLAACGSTPPPDAADRPADDASDTAPQDTGADVDGAPDDDVVSVTMTQEGGLIGILRTWRITERHPRHEHVFAAAGRDVLDGTTRNAGRTLPCCDLLEYEVVVQYADGSTKQMRTWDADDSDPALLALVTAVIDSEPWRLDAGD